MTITITIDKNDVLTALMRTAGYIGAKHLDGDKDAYRRISLTDDDSKLLERFWRESCDQLCMMLRRHIEAEGMEGDIYRMDLNVSVSFDTSMESALQGAMATFVMHNMTAKWLAITDRDAAVDYATESAARLSEISRQVLSKRKPRRPQLRCGLR